MFLKSLFSKDFKINDIQKRSDEKWVVNVA